MEVERRATPYGPFPAGYLECPLIALCVPEGGVQTGPFGSQLHKRDYVEVGTPIITVEHLGDNRILHDATPKVSDVDRDRLSRYQLRPGDIVFSRVGSVDRRALVSEEEAGWLFSGRCLRVRPNSELIDPTYLSYFFGLETFKEYVRSIAVGATMPSINTAILSNVPVIFPPSIHEQQAIASILKALDDKIELNRRMSETLEQLGRTEFERLVAVKPTCGLSAGDEWLITRVDTVAQISSGKRPPSRSPYLTQESSVPIWGSNGPMAYTSDPLIKDRILLTGRVGTLGNIFRVTSSSWPSDNTLVIRPMNEKAFEYLYFLLRTLDLASLNRGSTQPMLTQSDVKSQRIPVPPDQVLEKYYGFASLLFARIDSASAENQVLADIRDSLLPKLLSGELRVPEAEQMISEVV